MSTEQLLAEVVCGDIQIEGAQITLPPDRYAHIQTRLDSYPADQRRPWSDPVKAFLSDRCAANFITKYFEARDLSICIPSDIWEINIFDTGLQIPGKLGESGLLTSHVRSSAAKKIIELSERDRSCSFAKSAVVQKILTPEEIDEATRRIAKTILTQGSQLMVNMKNDWDHESDPADIFSEIDSTLEFIVLDERFDEDNKAAANELREQIKTTVRDLNEELVEPSYDKLEAELAEEAVAPTSRSVFDDVDQ